MTDQDAPPLGAAPEDLAEVGDADLVLRTRSGNSQAFGELWRRHYRSGITVARSVTSSLDADDLVQESYARIYQSILKGGGPTGSFRAYLFTSIRNTAAGWGRARKETAIDELDAVEDPATSEQATDDALDRSLTAQAFRSLPTRWQEVLWYSEIEQMKPAEIAPLLGMKATAVAQLTFRAREGLREAWIQVHLRNVEDGSDCQWTIERLGAYSRNNLGPRDEKKLEKHLGDCARCTIVAGEAQQVSNRLALVLLPLTVGVAGTAAYLAMIQGGGAAIVTLAAMPSSVLGAVSVGPATTGVASATGSAAGGAGGAAGGTTAGAAGAAGAAAGGAAVATGGALSSMGALIGMAAVGIVVAGAVVAAAVVPATLRGTPAPPPAAVISAETPDEPAAVDDPGDGVLVPLAPTATPTPTPTPDEVAETTPPASEPTDEVDPRVPTVPAQPTEPTGPTEPTDPTGPTDPTDPTEPTEPTEPTDPVPPVDPPPPPPPPVDPVPTTPTLPAGIPAFGSVKSAASASPAGVNVTVTIKGAVGATVELLISGAPRATAVVGPGGTAQLAFFVTAREWIEASMRMHYIAGGVRGPSTPGLAPILWDGLF